jgi:hypothetical protein
MRCDAYHTIVRHNKIISQKGLKGSKIFLCDFISSVFLKKLCLEKIFPRLLGENIHRISGGITYGK